MGVKRALDGVQILDCTQILAGPFCTMLLADMGADVIKIEKPAGGDDTRRMGPPFVDDTAAAFLMVNRNKRSIVIDLKQQEGKRPFFRKGGIRFSSPRYEWTYEFHWPPGQ